MSEEHSENEQRALDALLKSPSEKGQHFFSRSKRRHREEEPVPLATRKASQLPATYRYTVPIFTVLLISTWWLKPLFSGRLTNVFSFEQAWPLLAYSTFTALDLAFLVVNRFQRPDWRFYASLAASLLVLFSSSLRNRFEITALLALFLLVLILLPFPSVQLQNAIGLAALSALLTFSVPVSITFLAYNYVDQDFLSSSWHLFYASLFYFTPLFLPKAKGRLLSLFTGGAFIVNLVLTLGLQLNVILAILFILAAFTFSCIRPQTYRFQPIVALALLLLTTLIL